MDVTKMEAGAFPEQSVVEQRLDRRTLLQLSGAGVAMAFTGRDIIGRDDHDGDARARTRLIARRLLGAIASADTTAIWSMFARGGYVDLPFLSLRISDGATLEAAVGPLLANFTGLTFTAPTFVDLDDTNGVIVKFKGHAVVATTGKPYDQTYISEVHVRGNKVASYTEYFDTAVLNEALTP